MRKISVMMAIIMLISVFTPGISNSATLNTYGEITFKKAIESDVISYKASVDFTFNGTEESYKLMLASYVGNKLEELSCKDVTVSNNCTETVSLEFDEGNSSRSFKAMLWNDAYEPLMSEVKNTEFTEIFMEGFDDEPIGSNIGLKGTSIVEKAGSGNKIVIAKDTDNYLHYYRKSSDPYIEFSFPTEEKEIIMEYSIYPVSIKNSSQITFNLRTKDSIGKFVLSSVNSSGNVKLADGTTVGKMNMNKWNRLIFALRQDKREYDVFINGIKRKSNIPFPVDDFSSVSGVRITPSQYTGVVEYYVDNIAVYSGSSTIGDIDSYFEKFYSQTLSHDEKVIENCVNTIAFSTNSNRAVINRKLVTLSKKPVLKNGEYYLPEDALSAFKLGSEPDFTEINGSKFYSVTRLAKILGYRTYAEESGFVLLSKDADKAYDDYTYYFDLKLAIQYDVPKDSKIYSDFLKTSENTHPRLILTENDFTRLKNEIQTDSVKKEYFKQLEKKAEKYLDFPNPTYTRPDGTRMDVHDVREPAIVCAFMYWMTGDERYSDKAKEIILTVTQFDDWNHVHHYLDTGVAGSYTAIVYDWLYHRFEPEEKQIVEDGIKRNMLDTAYSGLYKNSWNTFPDNVHRKTGSGNWSAICMSGTILSALAIMETNPGFCSRIVEGALGNFRKMLPGFEPDGAWEEGLAYWGYANTFYMYIIEAMQSALGDDYGFYNVPGIEKTAYYPYDITGAKGVLNFGDCDEKTGGGNNIVVPWHADSQNNKELYTLRYNEILNGADVSVYDVIYMKESEILDNDFLHLDSYYREVESGCMRSGIFNPDATYIGFHAGANTAGHRHYDTGVFVFDSMGVRWASDLGQDNYNLSTYNNNQDNGIYRIRTEGHNCYVINPDKYVGQTENNENDGIIKMESNTDSAYIIMDLSQSYSEDAYSAKRGIKLGDNRSTFLLRDEIELKKPSEFYWFMHTRANVTIEDNIAYMEKDGKKMKFEFISDQPLELTTMAAQPLTSSPDVSGQSKNSGVTKIVLKGNVKNKLNITVKMSPVKSNVTYSPISVLPLGNWTLD